MRPIGVSTKIAIYACGVVFLLLALGSFVLIRFEMNMVQSIAEENLKKLHQVIDGRTRAEKQLLQENIKFNANNLCETGSSFLFDVDQQGMEKLLRAYIQRPEIVAIQVKLDDKNAFAAVWKTPDITAGASLPAEMNAENLSSIVSEAFYNGHKVGVFQIFYTETALLKDIERAEQQAFAEMELLHQGLYAQLQRAIIGQSIGVVLIIVILTVYLLFLVRFLIIKPMLLVSAIARRLAAFDLTVSTATTRKDEIGKLFSAINDMAQSFRNALGQAQRSGLQVTSSASEMSVTARQQEAIITHQAESTRNVLESVREISDVAATLVTTMRHVVMMLGETAAFANAGQADLTQMGEAMRGMEASSQSVSARLQGIREQAVNITTIVTTITKVADQTNLLSLNASIEAEKAGEYGRGFTVVAREIRRLADEAAVATLDIDQMIQEMQVAVSSGVMEMDQFIGEVRQSVADVQKISDQLSRIIEQVQVLSPSFEEVNIAMTQQSDNAQKINLSMSILSDEMQETRESLHETFLAIEQMNTAARSLQDEVSHFKVN